MSETHIIQIVPRRGRTPDGIRDYAVQVASGLRHTHGIDTTFVSGSPLGGAAAADDGWPTVTVSSRTAHGLTTALALARATTVPGAEATVLLHVSGYGYAKRGAPLWLLHGLRRWRHAAGPTRLVCVFHELYARGKPWQSSFWLGPVQKHVAQEIWRLADAGLTPTRPYHRELMSWRQQAGDRLLCMPVLSNVGEPVDIRPVMLRQPQAVVFGGAGTVAPLYSDHGRDIGRVLRAHGIERIIDLGPRLAPVPGDVDGVPVHVMGPRPAGEVSDLLHASRLGVLAYDRARLGKSGVLAAYAAHGVVPVCVGSRGDYDAGLVGGEHVLDSSADGAEVQSVIAMQQAIVAWYRSHAADVLVGQLAALIGAGPTAPGETAGNHREHATP